MVALHKYVNNITYETGEGSPWKLLLSDTAKCDSSDSWVPVSGEFLSVSLLASGHDIQDFPFAADDTETILEQCAVYGFVTQDILEIELPPGNTECNDGGGK
jgi:hypothetical protein